MFERAVLKDRRGHRKSDGFVCLRLRSSADEQCIGVALRFLSRRLGLTARLRDGLLRLRFDLSYAVVALDGVLSRLHGAVDRVDDVLREAKGAVDRELVDDDAVLVEDVPTLL